MLNINSCMKNCLAHCTNNFIIILLLSFTFITHVNINLVFAADVYWDGEGGLNSNYWSIANNWSTNSIPNNGDSLFFYSPIQSKSIYDLDSMSLYHMKIGINLLPEMSFELEIQNNKNLKSESVTNMGTINNYGNFYTTNYIYNMNKIINNSLLESDILVNEISSSFYNYDKSNIASIHNFSLIENSYELNAKYIFNNNWPDPNNKFINTGTLNVEDTFDNNSNFFNDEIFATTTTDTFSNYNYLENKGWIETHSLYNNSINSITNNYSVIISHDNINNESEINNYNNGVIDSYTLRNTNGGFIHNHGFIEATELINGENSVFTNYAGAFINNNWNQEMVIENYGTMSNQYGAMIYPVNSINNYKDFINSGEISTANFNNYDTLSNFGIINYSTNMMNEGLVTNQGKMDFENLQNNANSLVTNYDKFISQNIDNKGTIENKGGAEIQANTKFTNVGTLKGLGDIITPEFDNFGVLEVGYGLGQIMNIDGDYHQYENAVFNINLGSSDQYDILDISGSAYLNGILNINLINDYTPIIGDFFDIIEAGTISGMFSSIIGDTGASWIWAASIISPEGGSVDYLRLTATSSAPVPIPGAAWLLGSALLGLVGFRRKCA